MKGLLHYTLEKQVNIVRQTIEGVSKSWECHKCISAILSDSEDEVQFRHKEIEINESEGMRGMRSVSL